MSEETKVLKRSAKHQPETVAEAMTLLGAGFNAVKVSELTGVPERTLRDWARSPALQEKYGEAIKAGRERIAFRTTQLADRVLDQIEDGEIAVTPVAAFTMWGIATDKVQKDQDHSTPDRHGPFLIYVEGEAKVTIQDAKGNHAEIEAAGSPVPPPD